MSASPTAAFLGTVPTERIRNVALIGHGGVGKTTLAEALLHRAGVTSRRGTIEEGTTALDRDEEEIERQMSLGLGVATFDWTPEGGQAHRITLLDTPGDPDFVAKRDAALAVADLAVLVVSASEGLEVGTHAAWKRCEELGLPCMVFVTREDRARANFDAVLDQLRSTYGASFTPLDLPWGSAGGLHGVVDLLSEQALDYDADGSHHTEPMPAELADQEHTLHETVVEEIVTGDEAELEAYLDGNAPDKARLERTLAKEVLDRSEIPVLVGSGLTGVGVDLLADYVCEIGPSPADRPTVITAGDEIVEITASNGVSPLLYVFDTVADQYVTHVTLFKVVTGTLNPDSVLVNSRNGEEVRVHSAFRLVGSQHHAVGPLVAGEIAGAAKLPNIHAGTTLAPANQPAVVPAPTLPEANFAVAIKPATQQDEDRLAGALAKLTHEDPSLRVDHESSRQVVLRGVGETHVLVAIGRLKRKFNVDVSTEPVEIGHLCTITESAEAQGRVKKQSGGHGQFAVVDLRISPLPTGSGLEFVDSVVGGAIPKNYVQAVRRGIEEAMADGDINGVPLVDLRVDCHDGRTHAVDSSELAFKIAAGHGLREAVAKASPVLLEPIMRLEITVPADLQGAVLGDISAKRGKVISSRADRDVQTIVAEVPAAELNRYPVELRSLTGGRGSYTQHQIGYEKVPSTLESKVRAALPVVHPLD